MQYVTVFDASHIRYFNFWPLAVGLGLTIVGAFATFRPDLLEQIGFREKPHPASGALFLLFALAWTVLAGGATLATSSRLSEAASNNECQTVEGRVEHFHPMPWEGHQSERFDVNGVSFAYSDYILTGGFNNAASHGGPIKEGLPVRICYSDGLILRLEIEDAARPN